MYITSISLIDCIILDFTISTTRFFLTSPKEGDISHILSVRIQMYTSHFFSSWQVGTWEVVVCAIHLFTSILINIKLCFIFWRLCWPLDLLPNLRTYLHIYSGSEGTTTTPPLPKNRHWLQLYFTNHYNTVNQTTMTLQMQLLLLPLPPRWRLKLVMLCALQSASSSSRN